MKLANAAIALIVASAVVVCFLVARLFVTQLANLAFRVAVAVAFVLGMLLLVAGLILFLVEINLALRGVGVRKDLLKIEERHRRPGRK